MTLDIKPGSVVVGVDDSAHAERAIRWAAEQATLERRALAVVTAGDRRQWVRAVADRAVESALRRWPGLPATAHGTLGDPRTVLSAVSRDAHLLVIGSRGRGVVRSRLLGSVSSSVLRRAHSPVVVCRPDSPGLVRRGILVGTEGTPQDRAVLEFAFQCASMRALPLTVLHAFGDLAAAVPGAHLASPTGAGLEEERLLLAESVAGFSEKFPEVHVGLGLARGLVHDCLAANSGRWHLVVVGRHPTDSVTRRVSPVVATAVVERARTTVAVVPAPAPA